jgi:hypothetical protein
MARNNNEHRKNDSPEGAEPECANVPDSSPVATESPPAATATEPKKRGRKALPRTNGTSRKRSQARAASSHLPEEVAAECLAVRERIHQVDESAQELAQEVDRGRERVGSALGQTEGLREEASQVREQVRGTAREINEEAGEALHQVRQARQEADLVRFEVGQVRQEVEQVQQELADVRQRQRDAGLKTHEALRSAGETLDQLEQARQHHDEGRRQLEVVRLQVVEARSFLETVRQECQTASQILQQELRQHREETQHCAHEARRDLEESAQQARALLEQVHDELEAMRSKHQPPAHEALPPAEDTAVIQASVRPETPAERVLRHLHHAWAVKDAVAQALHGMLDEVVDMDLRAALADQHQLTEKQKQELERQLRALGGEPTSSKGALQRLASWLWESWKREPDDYDRALQNLVKAVTAQQAEVTLAQVLAVLAAAGGDAETADLALRHRAEKQAAVQRLQQFIVPVSELAIHLPASAMAAAQQLLVEAGVTEAPPEEKTTA